MSSTSRNAFADRLRAIPSTVAAYLRQPQVWGFFVSLAAIFILSLCFFYPDASEGNQLRQHDMQQGAAIGQEVKAWMAENPGADEPSLLACTINKLKATKSVIIGNIYDHPELTKVPKQ